METSEKDLAWYMEELNSNGCACDRPKQPQHSFCTRCFAKLPPEMRRNIYRALGHGYEDAYEAAHKYLEENVWNRG